jgi:NADPH:quinone reductase
MQKLLNQTLSFEDIETPDPLPDEVLIKVYNVSVNVTLDLAFRKGLYPRNPPFPHVIGTDPVGEVAAVGDGVTRIQPGERVGLHTAIPSEKCLPGYEADDPGTFKLVGLDRWGGYAEYVSVPENIVFAIPESLSYPEATVIMRHLPTARHLLHRRAQLKEGEWVLVMGATGGLASCCVQVAKLMGANVIAAAGSDERVQMALDLFGADYGVNYRTQDLALEVRKITDGHGADVVADNIGDPELWQFAIDSLAAPGRLVTAGAHAGAEVKLNLAKLYRARQTIIGYPLADFADTLWATAATEDGSIRAPLIDRIMPLRDAADAHRLVERRVPVGKILLDPIV